MEEFNKNLDKTLDLLNQMKDDLTTSAHIFNIKNMQKIASSAGINHAQWLHLKHEMEEYYKRFVANDEFTCTDCGETKKVESENVGYDKGEGPSKSVVFAICTGCE